MARLKLVEGVVVATAHPPEKGGVEVVFIGDVGEVFQERDHDVCLRELVAGFRCDVWPAARWRWFDVCWVDM
jgi:hypothetical protein